VEEPDGAVRFVLKDGTEIHRLPPPDLVYDNETGEPCRWGGRHGELLPLDRYPLTNEESTAHIGNVTLSTVAHPHRKQFSAGLVRNAIA